MLRIISPAINIKRKHRFIENVFYKEYYLLFYYLTYYRYYHIITPDGYRLQSQLHTKPGLKLSVHPAETVHSNNSLLHDLFFHIIRALQNIFS